ncbi:hypothetical protein CDAR_427081 [Caerostris darwini]|uniref:Uncharacterized protein n=1 Tax=Caerostris darwini TaxID=1538125 RepID=A0AAV4R546_9ARAC|nr:hypothetical protein CDAR_427081 [Caerostris darwini]
MRIHRRRITILLRVQESKGRRANIPSSTPNFLSYHPRSERRALRVVDCPAGRIRAAFNLPQTLRDIESPFSGGTIPDSSKVTPAGMCALQRNCLPAVYADEPYWAQNAPQPPFVLTMASLGLILA